MSSAPNTPRSPVAFFEIIRAAGAAARLKRQSSFESAKMVTETDQSDVKFNGSNWTDFTRIVALAKFAIVQDDDYDNNEERKCAHLASRYSGPALDWAAYQHANVRGAFSSFDRFVNATREAFGIADNNVTALLRRQLDDLSWQSETPVFFAEFDRLTSALGITSHETRVAMVEQKLPLQMKALLAQQALSFANYDTMRERLNCMWAMDPSKSKKVTHPSAKPRCGTCGKKGHTATNCRSKN